MTTTSITTTATIHRIQQLATELDQLGRTALDKAAEAGRLLTECKSNMKHGEWLPWLSENFTFTDRTASNWMRLALQLDAGLLKSETVSDLGLTAAYRLITGSATDEPDVPEPDEPEPDEPEADEPEPLVEDGTKAAAPEQTRPHVSQNTGEHEWFTPPEFIASARAVMGGIDLDPASCTIANKTVRATRFYDKAQDGLDHDWKGRVWLNPPYSQPLCSRFCEKLCNSLTKVAQAIALVNNGTETQWFQRMAAAATAVCFPLGRVKFIGSTGSQGAPLQGQALLYFGPDAGKFVAEFKRYGATALLRSSTNGREDKP